jgi:electron transfer flavoprotein-quinone oxidoreductase
VVGAGPAGAAAALELARAGRSVVLLERGPFPGAKNVYGGVVYGRVLDNVIPRWWEQVPVQRWVVRRSTMMLTGSQALSVDFRSEAWGTVPYNDFDSWLAGHAVAAGAELVTSTVATGLLRDEHGAVTGVRTDRPGGELRARAVIACDGVNSFLAKEAGLLPQAAASHHTLGVKEVLDLPAPVIEERFGLGPHQGVDIEMLGATVSVGIVVSLPGLARAKVRPEQLIADLKAHPAIAPYLRGSSVREYSAHLIPEGGYDAIPRLAVDGMLVAGDAAGLCLAAGLWLEGVNFAIGSGLAAGRAVTRAIGAGDTSARGLASYRRDLESGFVLADHKRLRRAPGLVLSDRIQQRYPGLLCDLAEGVFTVTNPRPKPGLLRLARRSAQRNGVRVSELLRDAAAGARVFR